MENNGPNKSEELGATDYKVEPNIILKKFSILLKKCDYNLTMPRSSASTSRNVSDGQESSGNNIQAPRRRGSLFFDPKNRKRPRGLLKREFKSIGETVKGNPPTLYSKTTAKATRTKRTLKSIKQIRKRRKGRMRGRRIGNSVSKSASDENSSNSDNSESHGLFDEINWEENLEVDTSSLLDEFAPRPPASSPSSESQDSFKAPEIKVEIKQEIKEEPPELEEAPPVVVQLPSSQEEKNVYEFVPGSEIHVKDYNTTEWYAANVIEVDWEEEEVLVHFKENMKPDEWVSMNSQRLSQNRPSPASATIIETVITPGTDREGGGKLRTGTAIDRRSNVIQKSDEMKISRKSVKTTLQKRFHKHLKKDQDGSLNKSHISKSYSKDRFEVGEKVLAKWSNHRMQKFPAIIKKVLRNGTYDVLFYDGFEKTLNRDDLYKTTEEEVAKYQHSNPSEADSFVDMDIGAKEERRQRKRKTFDDYFFLKDFQRPRKKAQSISEIEKSSMLKPSKNSGLVNFPENRSLNLANVNDDLKLSPTLHNLSVKSRHLKRRRKLTQESSVKDESFSDEMEHPNEKDTPIDNKLNEQMFDYSDQTLSAETCLSLDETGEPKKASQFTDGERWIGDIPPDVHPTIITGIDGIPRKSVIVPDKNLPSGWSKHAVMRQSGGHWESFLVSPEGYRIHSQQKLQDYYLTFIQIEPPEALDFKLCIRALPELVLKQKDKIAKGTYQKWEKKRGRRRKSFASDDNSLIPEVHQQVGRVKTLLPKYRSPQPQAQTQPTTSTQPPSVISTENVTADSEVWRCPKQGCDKKFRKENLLQMHIKHYHVEFKALVGSAPKVEDLACARSESANSDWRGEQNKSIHGNIKRIMPKQHGGVRINFMEKSFERQDGERSALSPQMPQVAQTHSPTQGVSMIKNETPQTDDSIVKRQPLTPVEEKKTTIKTILPLRHALQESSAKSVMDSDDGDSDEDLNLNETQKSLSMNKMYKISRNKKIKMESKFSSSISAPMDDIGMRDHGYPMYPSNRFTKKKQIPALDKLQIATDSNDSYTEEEKPSPNTEAFDDTLSVERLQSEELINCTCGIKEEDGLMIQCDICLCWQHGLCYGIKKESEVPESYVCCICQNPLRVRSSKKYSYAQVYLTQAKLPTLSFRTSKEDETKHRENMLKRCYDISASLHQIQNVERSLRAKINIAEQPDHPKLYLWAKNWDENSNVKYEENETEVKVKNLDDGNESDTKSEGEIKTRVPEPEAPIDLEECRLKLLDHVEQSQQHVESRLTTLEAQIAALESQDPDLASEETNDRYPHTKQTVHMLLRDLTTIRKVAAIS